MGLEALEFEVLAACRGRLRIQAGSEVEGLRVVEVEGLRNRV